MNADENLPAIELDDRLMRRVILNLLHNAQKFTKEGGAVSLNINYNAAGREIITEIKDDGPGIKAEDQLRLFEKFSQLERGAVQNEKGFGLGLAFCRMAVGAHSGRIWLKSSPGEGSSFFFSLPAGGAR